MAEEDKQQMGDGADDYAQAIRQALNGMKRVAKTASVGGTAAAQIAAGSAAGPLGAIISAAWSLKHTLYKILVCIGIAMVILIVIITSLPGIVINQALGFGENQMPASMRTVYETVSDVVSASIQDDYEESLELAEKMIADGGYDKELSLAAMVDLAADKMDYDVAYIASVYSASMEQKDLSQEDMEKKLSGIAKNMFPVTAQEMVKTITQPVSYFTYKPVEVTVVTKITFAGIVNGVLMRDYETEVRTYYVADEQCTTDTELVVDAYAEVSVLTPVYTEGNISGTQLSSYFLPADKKTLVPETKQVKYLECTIHPFDQELLLDAFGIDPDAAYEGLSITYGEVIESRAEMLKRTLFGNNQQESDEGEVGEINGRKK